ncbi:MAG: glycosyltransferase family 2 protein [Acidiferrobacteraceae bacterium]
MNHSPAVSVVVVSFNSAPCLGECIRRALAPDTAITVEVVVVDNASSDHSADVVSDMARQGLPVTLIKNTANLGFARACNQGAQAAHGRYLLFLNPDCFLERGALGLTVAVLDRYPEAAAAGGLVLNPNGSAQRGCRRRIPDPAQSFYRIAGLSRLAPGRFADFDQNDEPLPMGEEAVEAISGSYLLIHRADFEALGGWDEGYFLHCEDLDLCQRIRDRGRSILFVPQARAVHLKGESSRRAPVRTEWHKHRGMLRFYRKFQARNYGTLMTGLVISGVALHFLVRAAGSVLGLRAR